MFAFDQRAGAAAFGVTAGVLLAQRTACAADAGRLEMLAAEAARWAGTPAASPAHSLAPIVVFMLGTMLAALAGTFFGMRRFAWGRIREKDGWREVTYRFRSHSPLRLGSELLGRLNGILHDLEGLGPQLRDGRPRAAGAPVAGAEQPLAPQEPNSADEAPRRPRRAGRYERARDLLGVGWDPAAVRQVTGLRLAELDLVRSRLSPPGRAERPSQRSGLRRRQGGES